MPRISAVRAVMLALLLAISAVIAAPPQTQAADSAEQKWQWSVPTTYEEAIVHVTDERVVLVLDSSIVYGLDRKSGEQKWVIDGFSTGQTAYFSAIDDTLYGALGEDLRAWDLDDGEAKWSAAIGQEVLPPIFEHDGNVFLGATADGASTGFVYALSEKNGETKWTFTLDGGWGFFPIPYYGDGRVIVTSKTTAYGLGDKDGEVKWSQDTTAVWPLFSNDIDLDMDGVIILQSSPLMWDASTSLIAAHDIKDGDQKWSLEVPGMGASADRNKDQIVVANGQSPDASAAAPNDVALYDVESGERKWSASVTGIVRTVRMVGDVVLVEYDDSSVEARSRDDGRPLWSIPAASGKDFEGEVDGRLVFEGGGSVDFCSAESGNIDRQITGVGDDARVEIYDDWVFVLSSSTMSGYDAG